MSDADEAETLRRVDVLIVTSLTASHHYRVWAALTDRYERERDERAEEAVADMQRAASEWLGIKDNPDARERYFDKWLYDRLGYERD